MRGLFCYRGGCRTQRPVPHVLIIHLFFVPLSATNYLQKYTNFLTSQRFHRKKIRISTSRRPGNGRKDSYEHNCQT